MIFIVIHEINQNVLSYSPFFQFKVDVIFWKIFRKINVEKNFQL